MVVIQESDNISDINLQRFAIISPMSRRIEALGAVLTRHSPAGELQIGIFQRADGRSLHKGMHELMGGEFKTGETPEMVLRRELREKTQLAPISIGNEVIVEINEGEITVRRHAFLCEFPQDATPHIDPAKHQGFIWANLEQIHQMTDLVPGTWKILEAVGIQ